MSDPWRSDAYVNKDGLYTVPDPEVNDREMVETDTGLFIPKPRHKSVRILNFDFQYHLEIEEDIQTVCKVIDEACADESIKWVSLHDPTFGTELRIPRSACLRVACVLEGWKDMEMLEMQMKEVEQAKRMQRLNLEKPNMPRPVR